MHGEGGDRRARTLILCIQRVATSTMPGAWPAPALVADVIEQMVQAFVRPACSSALDLLQAVHPTLGTVALLWGGLGRRRQFARRCQNGFQARVVALVAVQVTPLQGREDVAHVRVVRIA